MNQIPSFPCHIKELNISCFGCCGNKFSSKEKIEKNIEENTKDLLKIGKKLNSKKLMEFRERFDGDTALSLDGLCYNLVDLGSGCLGCPLHPEVNKLKVENFEIDNKKDIRIGHCDINEECKTFIAWKTMSDKEKKDFIEWLKENKYDNYKYSIENGEETLFEKYLKRK